MLALAGRLRQSADGARTGRGRLTLVTWSPACLSPDLRPGTTAVMERLRQMSRHLGIDFSKIDVWCPSEEELD